MRRITVAFVLTLVVLLMASPAALAHTAFESSDPADGTSLEEPIRKIRIVFSAEAEPAGDGFLLLSPDGDLLEPDRVTSRDNLTWVLHFDDPIGGGVFGVRWQVAAPDAHPINGTFSFTVPETANESAGMPAPQPTSAGSDGGADPVAAPQLQEFLAVSTSEAPLAGAFGALSRTASMLGALMAAGGIVFAAVVLRGSRSDVRSVLFWVRRASVLLVLGSVGELVHQLALVNGTWGTIWPLTSLGSVVTSPVGIAIVLRAVGGAMMLRAHLEVVPAMAASDPVLALQGAVPLGAGPQPPGNSGSGEPYVHDDDMAWRVDGALGLVFAGVAFTLVAFAFDGHTVTEGTRLLTSIATVAHAGTAAVWAGGLVMLVHVIWLRHRRGRDSRALQLAVRFSVVAAIALAVAGAAGTFLTFTILDSFSQLWTTTWGRVLLAKVAVVAVAAASGAYNHKVLIPHMMRRLPNDPAADAEFRRTVTIEGAAMMLVILLTAILVASSSQ